MDSNSKERAKPPTLRVKKPIPLPRTKLSTRYAARWSMSDTLLGNGKSPKNTAEKCNISIEVQKTEQIGNIDVTKQFNPTQVDMVREPCNRSVKETTKVAEEETDVGNKVGNRKVLDFKSFTIPGTSSQAILKTNELIKWPTNNEPFTHTSLHVQPDTLRDELPLVEVYKHHPCTTVQRNLFETVINNLSEKSNLDQCRRSQSPEDIIYEESKTFLISSPLNYIRLNSTMTGHENNENNVSQNKTLESTKPQGSALGEKTDIEDIDSPDKCAITEFDPLYTKNPESKYKGVSNKQLLDAIVIEDSNQGDNISNECKKVSRCQLQDVNPITQMECAVITIPETQEEYEDVEESEPMIIPDTLTSQDTFLQTLPLTNATTAGTISQNEIVNISSFTRNNLDIEVQTVDDMKPLTGRPKCSPISKLKKLFSTLTEQKTNVLARPPLNSYGPHFNGILTWIGDDNLAYNSKSWHCALAEQRLFCYVDPGMHVLREVFKLSSINSLQLVLPVSLGTNSSYCFELSMSNSENSGLKHGTPFKITFGCTTPSERLTWAQKIAANLTSAFPSINNSEFSRLGWCYLKVGVSGEWHAAWLVLVQRVLMYHCTNNIAGNADLRKTRCLIAQRADEESIKACPSDCCSNLLLDCSIITLYLRFPHKEEFQSWNSVINLAAHSNGSQIDEQQLTSEEVPTIVDKCINFIYAYGILSEGIYRRAGSSVILTELMTRFRNDAWSVQLTPQNYSEHDVAGVLKRFFRDLPTPLIRPECHDRLIKALAKHDEAERHAEYKRALNTLSLVPRKTARVLFAHLHFVHAWNDANKMSAENLASVWAPTIMPTGLATNIRQLSWSEREVNVVRDLILNYETVWSPDEAEIKRDIACHRVVMKMQNSASPAPPPSSAGDLRTWIYMFDFDNHCQVTLTPDKTSADICVELSDKVKIPYHKLMLEEKVCSNNLTRIVHKDEIVLDVVLRWGYWDEDDRKNNCLILKENKILHQMNSLKQTMSRVCGPLRFANEANKRFKSYMFEVSNSKLMCFSDTQGSTKIDEWDINNILWYFGYEPKRDPQSRWAITFIPKNKTQRSRERRWFGSTVAGSVTESELTWATALTFAQHENILPQPHDFMP